MLGFCRFISAFTALLDGNTDFHLAGSPDQSYLYVIRNEMDKSHAKTARYDRGSKGCI
jgi:hypothetical protein